MRLIVVIACILAAGCGKDAPVQQSVGGARHLLLITVDTLRADRVGAYGDRSARTPAMDGLAARGALFAHAYATAPITLPSHASMLTGRYPAGHGTRHNGMRVNLAMPTLAERLSRSGFATAAFVGGL